LREGNDAAEITHAIDALTTNFTHFMREEDHFHFLVEQALPQLVGLTPGPIRLWSAACATGEEPYSMAFFVEDRYPAAAGWDWRILATDISTKALAAAGEAIYRGDRMAAIPAAWQRRYFLKGFGAAEGQFRVKANICERIHFRQENLLGEHAGADLFHVIFCRNVMIYFDRNSQLQLVRHLCRYLMPGGYLLIGHSESLTGLPLPLKCLRPSYYQRTRD
jgi:chemotaxis protein methyltransferase CheR